MGDKQKQIPKEKAYSLFLHAFELAQITLEDDLMKGTVLKKPARGGYRKLAQAIAQTYDLDLKLPPFNNYENYLRSRFNDIKGLLGFKYEETFGFDKERFEPVIHFAQRKKGRAASIVFDRPVVFSEKKFSYINFWRNTDLGKLTMYDSHVVFESSDQRVSFKSAHEARLIRMPPFRGDWIKIEDQGQIFFLAVSDGNGKLSSIEPLKLFLHQ